MTERAPSLSDVIERTAERVRDEVVTQRAGRIVSHDPTTQRADVQLIHDMYREGPDGGLEMLPAPILRGVPVAMPRGGGRSVTWGMDQGDRVWVVFRDASGDEYDVGRVDGTYAPEDPRRFGLSDGVVYPLHDVPGRSDGQVAIVYPSGEVLYLGSQVAALLLARADLVLAELQAIEAGLDGHDHPLPTIVAPSGGGNCTVAPGPSPGDTLAGGSYTAPAAAADIASDRVQVDG